MKAGYSKLRGLKTPQFWSLVVTLMLLSLLTTILGRGPAKTLTSAHQIVVPATTPTDSLSPSASRILSPASKTPNCAVTACLALTFDDGPNPIATPIVLSALEQANVHATFFVIGSRAVTQPDLLQRMYKDGDEIGNHSWSHPDLTTLTPDQIVAQVDQTEAAVMSADVPAPTLFRPPYGAINPTIIANVHLPLILWNIDPKDWQIQDPAKITEAVESTAKAGGIVEMHDIYTTTGAAMPGLIANLKSRFALVTVSQLLDLQPGSQGIFYDR